MNTVELQDVTKTPQRVLSALMTRTPIRSFETAKPSLQDIFVRIAGPQAREANHA